MPPTLQRSALPLLVTTPLLVALAACAPKAAMVYVLESPQTVTLTPSASASSVRQGETVTLHVERRTIGKWKQIPRDQLSPGQCWVYRPPEAVEAEVADTVAWEAIPEGAIRFSAEVRMDHAKIATMVVKGSVKLTPIATLKCETDRVAEGPTIQIDVS